jgi:hypothetical protein
VRYDSVESAQKAFNAIWNEQVTIGPRNDIVRCHFTNIETFYEKRERSSKVTSDGNSKRQGNARPNWSSGGRQANEVDEEDKKEKEMSKIKATLLGLEGH